MGKKDRTVSLEQFIDSFEDPSKIASLTDFGMGVNALVTHCDREARLWRELQAVERACVRLRTKQLCETVRVVYRVVRFEKCAEDEQRALILGTLGVDEGAYYMRVEKIVKILGRRRM